MRITWHGHACFSLEWPGVTVLTDPFDDSVGYEMPQHQVDIVTISHEHYDHNFTTGLLGQPVIIRGSQVAQPAVAAAAGLNIKGLSAFHDKVEGQQRGINTIYRFDHPEISVAHLGDLGHLLTPELHQGLKGVDVLLIPVGGTYTIDGMEAAAIVRELNPRLVIPMHYQTEALRFKLAEVSDFTRHFDVVNAASATQVIIKPDELRDGAPSVLVLDYLFRL